MALRLLSLPPIDTPAPSVALRGATSNNLLSLLPSSAPSPSPSPAERFTAKSLRVRRRRPVLVSVGKEETELRVSEEEEKLQQQQQQLENASPEDLEYVRQIQRVLELLKKNRDMLFGEVKLTIMIEDPRESERKRLLGIEDPDEMNRDDLVAALEDVHEGRIPENRVALRLLAEEMMQWPNLEVEATKSKPRKSLYAKATDTGVDPQVAKRLNVDWDSAVEIKPGDEASEVEVPPAVGYGALYLVTALPLLIGTSVVLILFYNSLQ